MDFWKDHRHLADWLVNDYVIKILIGSWRDAFIIMDFNKKSNCHILDLTN